MRNWPSGKHAGSSNPAWARALVRWGDAQMLVGHRVTRNSAGQTAQAIPHGHASCSQAGQCYAHLRHQNVLGKTRRGLCSGRMHACSILTYRSEHVGLPVGRGGPSLILRWPVHPAPQASACSVCASSACLTMRARCQRNRCRRIS